jgi:hypothetical protein
MSKDPGYSDSRIDRAESKMRKLMNALEFYADIKNYNKDTGAPEIIVVDGYSSQSIPDLGKKAREALGLKELK